MEPDRGHLCQEGSHVTELAPLFGNLAFLLLYHPRSRINTIIPDTTLRWPYYRRSKKELEGTVGLTLAMNEPGRTHNCVKAAVMSVPGDG